jgi:hypothetical protein
VTVIKRFRILHHLILPPTLHQPDKPFKCFRSAAITLAGIELMHGIRKGQFNLVKLSLKDTAAPAVWNAILSARRYP